MTINLLEEFIAGRVKLLSGGPDLVHAGRATISGDCREYIFLHPPASLAFSIPGYRMRLSCGLAVHPDVWEKKEMGGTEFRVILDGKPLFHKTLDPGRNPQHKNWVDVEVDVPGAGPPSRSLVLSTRGIGGCDYRWALWSQPILEPAEPRTFANELGPNPSVSG